MPNKMQAKKSGKNIKHFQRCTFFAFFTKFKPHSCLDFQYSFKLTWHLTEMQNLDTKSHQTEQFTVKKGREISTTHCHHCLNNCQQALLFVLLQSSKISSAVKERFTLG